jgi:Zn-dependent M16 (insulinase) family peptidase
VTVIDYHKTAYVPQNITIVVSGGAVHPENLLSTLTKEVEPLIKAHGQAKGPTPPGWDRPFVETSTRQNPPTLERDEIEVVLYPEADESVGQVNITWIGPPAKDFITAAGLSLLGDYLSGSAIAPLNQLFVEVKDPSCSSKSEFSSSD